MSSGGQRWATPGQVRLHFAGRQRETHFKAAARAQPRFPATDGQPRARREGQYWSNRASRARGAEHANAPSPDEFFCVALRALPALSQRRGFTLIEMLVAMVITLMMVGDRRDDLRPGGR